MHLQRSTNYKNIKKEFIKKKSSMYFYIFADNSRIQKYYEKKMQIHVLTQENVKLLERRCD